MGRNSGASNSEVSAPNAEHNERTGVPDHGGTYCLRKLVSVLVRKGKVRCEFTRFRQERGKRVGAKSLEFVDVHEERHPFARRPTSPLHGDELKVRDEKRSEQIRRLLPYRPLGQVRDQDTPMVHREFEIEARSDLAEDQAQLWRGVHLPDLIQDRCERFRSECFLVAWKFLMPEAQCFGILHAT